MSNALDAIGQSLGRTAIKSLKVETAFNEPVEFTAEELFADTSEGSNVDWIVGLVKPVVTIGLGDSMRGMGLPAEIVIAPAGVPTGHKGWIGLVAGALLGAVGIYALGYYSGRRSSRSA